MTLKLALRAKAARKPEIFLACEEASFNELTVNLKPVIYVASL